MFLQGFDFCNMTTNAIIFFYKTNAIKNLNITLVSDCLCPWIKLAMHAVATHVYVCPKMHMCRCDVYSVKNYFYIHSYVYNYM